MAGLVNDLLDVEKLEAGKFELYIDDTNFATIAMRALESIEGLADRQNVVIEEKLQDLYVQADPDRSVQIVLNFLSNALKYSPRGGKITVEIRKHGSMAELSVQDEGPGISDQEQKQLFERFRQVGTLKEKKRRGTGLGLAICKMLAEQQQGGVGVESEAGKGSRFWVSLPLSRQD